MLKFYYQNQEEVIGPLTGIELREAAFAGHVRPTTLVANDPNGKWVPASRIRNLFGEDGTLLPHPAETQRAIEAKRQLSNSSTPPAEASRNRKAGPRAWLSRPIPAWVCGMTVVAGCVLTLLLTLAMLHVQNSNGGDSLLPTAERKTATVSGKRLEDSAPALVVVGWYRYRFRDGNPTGERLWAETDDGDLYRLTLSNHRSPTLTVFRHEFKGNGQERELVARTGIDVSLDSGTVSEFFRDPDVHTYNAKYTKAADGSRMLVNFPQSANEYPIVADGNLEQDREQQAYWKNVISMIRSAGPATR